MSSWVHCKELAMRDIGAVSANCRSREPGGLPGVLLVAHRNSQGDQELGAGLKFTGSDVRDAWSEMDELRKQADSDHSHLQNLQERLQLANHLLEQNQAEIVRLKNELVLRREMPVVGKGNGGCRDVAHDFALRLERQLRAANEELGRLQGLTNKNKEDEYDDDCQVA